MFIHRIKRKQRRNTQIIVRVHGELKYDDDGDDIQCEITNVFLRCNLSISRFNHGSHFVKCVLFRSYCLCMYNNGLWENYIVTVLKKFKEAILAESGRVEDQRFHR